jgi:hypothetical protein
MKDKPMTDIVVCEKCPFVNAQRIANTQTECVLDAAASRDELLRALRLSYDALNYLGDVLNGMDASRPEDVLRIGPAFHAVRAALAKYPEPESADDDASVQYTLTELPYTGNLVRITTGLDFPSEREKLAQERVAELEREASDAAHAYARVINEQQVRLTNAERELAAVRAIPDTISEAEADALGMPVAYYEKVIRFAKGSGRRYAPITLERSQKP